VYAADQHLRGFFERSRPKQNHEAGSRVSPINVSDAGHLCSGFSPLNVKTDLGAKIQSADIAHAFFDRHFWFGGGRLIPERAGNDLLAASAGGAMCQLRLAGGSFLVLSSSFVAEGGFFRFRWCFGARVVLLPAPPSLVPLFGGGGGPPPGGWWEYQKKIFGK